MWDGKKRNPQKNGLSFLVIVQSIWHCCLRSVTSSKDMSWTFLPSKSGYTLSREEGDEVGDGVRAGEIERFIFAN